MPAPPQARPAVTAESVTEGHPDKVCDYIADSILDAHLEGDRRARVACEVLCKGSHLVLAGEITSRAEVDYQRVAREAIAQIGYIDPTQAFSAGGVELVSWITEQAAEIRHGVDGLTDPARDQGAGDQGSMFGYATDETPELMPVPVLLAHRLARLLSADRKGFEVPWLKPDGKTQVSVVYEGGVPCRVSDVVISAQHADGVPQAEIRAYIIDSLAPRALGRWFSPGIRFAVNPAGSFVQGGPSADAGVTGRKIIVDTYGGAARHGGGAFSGKDPSKVDRSAAYFSRWAARQIVGQGIGRRAEVHVAYAIGQARPVSLRAHTFATGDDVAANALVSTLDFRPAAIVEQLDLLRPIYRQTTNYGHFGRPGLPWET